MKIALIHGTERKSSTYTTSRMLVENLGPEAGVIAEFFLPRDMPEFCRGCGACFQDETRCPHYDFVRPIRDAVDRADLIIMTSPVYVYYPTGQLKALLDHFGVNWVVHRPQASMFTKRAVVISTTAGGGLKTTLGAMKRNLSMWGVGRVYSYGKAVRAISWSHVSEKTKSQIETDMRALGKKIRRKSLKTRPGRTVRFWFQLSRFMQKKFGFSEADVAYWKHRGWLDKTRPY